jgi:hypothetical protein
MQRHGLDGVHDGRRIEDDEVERLCAGAEVSFTEREVGFILDLEDEEPPADRLLPVERRGLGFTASHGRYRLDILPAHAGAVRAAVFVDGEPAVVQGLARVTWMSERTTLAGQLANAVGGTRRLWLALLERVLAQMSLRDEVVWTHGMVDDDPEENESVGTMAVYPLVRLGEEGCLLGLPGRMKSHLLDAIGVSALLGASVIPGILVKERFDHVVKVDYENPRSTTRATVREIVAGLGPDADWAAEVIEGRFHVLGMSQAPALSSLSDTVADLIARYEHGRWLLLIDSFERAVGTISDELRGTHDAWGAGVTALMNAVNDTRKLAGVPDLASLTADHVKESENAETPAVDTVAELRRQTAAGAKKKRAAFRGITKVGKLRETEDGVVDLKLVCHKPWPTNAGRHSEIDIRAVFDGDRSALLFRANDEARFAYPHSVRPGTRAARVYDTLAQSGSWESDSDGEEYWRPTYMGRDLLLDALRQTHPEDAGLDGATLASLLNRHPAFRYSADHRGWGLSS